MSVLLNWRLWLALGLAAGLAFTHFTAYRAGKATVRSEWNEAKLQDSENARLLARARQAEADKAQREAATRQAGILADAARVRTERDGLRGDLEAVQQHAGKSLDACRQSAAALTDVFQQCTSRYSDLAEKADRHASDTLMYQRAWPK